MKESVSGSKIQSSFSTACKDLTPLRLKKLLKDLREKEESLGVMGVARVPELFHGMQMCMGLRLPVVGIPLNANRCIRWLGAFHPTSVDLEAVRNLVREKNAE